MDSKLADTLTQFLKQSLNLRPAYTSRWQGDSFEIESNGGWEVTPLVDLPAESPDIAKIMLRPLNPAHIARHLGKLAVLKPLGKAEDSKAKLKLYAQELGNQAQGCCELALIWAVDEAMGLEEVFFPDFGRMLALMRYHDRRLRAMAAALAPWEPKEVEPALDRSSWPEWLLKLYERASGEASNRFWAWLADNSGKITTRDGVMYITGYELYGRVANSNLTRYLRSDWQLEQVPGHA